jgi:hypothetical protein
VGAFTLDSNSTDRQHKEIFDHLKLYLVFKRYSRTATQCSVLNQTCIKKASPKVHREVHLEGNGPSLVKSWNEAVGFWRAAILGQPPSVALH